MHGGTHSGRSRRPCTRARLADPVIPLELPAYQKKENWGAAETFYQIVRTLCAGQTKRAPQSGHTPRANILGPTALGFRHRDDIKEISGLLRSLGIEINVVAPMGARPADIARLPDADFNVVLYPEIANQAAQWLKRTFGQPMTRTVPIGVGATDTFLREVATLVNLAGAQSHLSDERSRLPWYSRSVDSTYLTGKRVFIFADATHALAAADIATKELGFTVAGLGTYSREFAREVREKAQSLNIEALITDDYLEVEQKVQELQPELVLGTQMERHIAKRHGIPCAVISAPVHVQDFPARYSPQVGFEGANVIFDTWVHPLMMGLEEHLLAMFREDFEFHDGAQPSHLAAHVPAAAARPSPAPEVTTETAAAVVAEVVDQPTIAATPAATQPAQPGTLTWTADAELELRKIPFFVRGKAKRNTEKYATEHGLTSISIETLYDAKAHYSR